MNENKQCEGGMCKDEKSGCCTDKCSGCGCGCGYGHKRLIKCAIKIVLLVLVACFAFQMGEMKGRFEGMFGNMHRGYGYGYYGSNMMYGNDATWNDAVALPPAPGALPATPVAPAR